MVNGDDRLLTVEQVARRLQLAPGTVRNMLRDPECPLRGAKLGRSLRVFESSVADLLFDGEKQLFEL